MLTVSVIIPAWNEAAAIRQAVESAWRCGACEVIVADGGSQDNTQVLAQSAGARVLAAPLGRAVQQNLGAAETTGDILLFLHADTWICSEAGTQIRNALQANPAKWGGAFRQRIDAGRSIYRLLERGNAARVRYRGVPFGDQGIFIRHDIFHQAGGFPAVALMEDLILMRQLRRAAWPLLLDGPIHVSPRRWQRHGVVRQTLRNWCLQAAWLLGTRPEQLVRWYPRHQDQRDSTEH